MPEVKALVDKWSRNYNQRWLYESRGQAAPGAQGDAASSACLRFLWMAAPSWSRISSIGDGNIEEGRRSGDSRPAVLFSVAPMLA